MDPGAVGMRTLVIRGETLIVSESVREPAYWNRYWDTVAAGEWEPDTFDALDRFLSPTVSFVDIGAWTGPLTLYAAKRCRWVYAVEPDPVARQTLFENVGLNNLRNVTVDSRAVSDRNGMDTIGNRHELGNSESSLNVPYRAVNVVTVRLEDLWAEYRIQDCGLVKIDTEGGEGFILPDAGAFLHDLKVPVHLSLHGDWVRADQREGLRVALARWGVAYDPGFRGSVLLGGRSC